MEKMNEYMFAWGVYKDHCNYREQRHGTMGRMGRAAFQDGWSILPKAGRPGWGIGLKKRQNRLRTETVYLESSEESLERFI